MGETKKISALEELKQQKSIDNALEEVPITIKMKDGERRFVLREFVGRDRDKWFSFLSERAVINVETGKVSNIKDYTGLQARLLSLCLYDDKNQEVPEEFIQSVFKGSVIEKLFKAAQELNGLDVKARDEAKND